MPIPRKRTAADSERALVEGALDTLRNLGVEAHVGRARPKDRGVGDTATLRRGTKRVPLQIEAKRALRPGTLGPVLLRLRELKPPGLLERPSSDGIWRALVGPKHVSAWNGLWIEEWIVHAASRYCDPCRSDMKRRVDYWKP